MRNKVITAALSVIMVITVCVLMFSGCGTKHPAEPTEKNTICAILLTPMNKHAIESHYPFVGDNLAMAIEKGLARKSFAEETYLKIEAAYVCAFDFYLNKQIDINQYQKILDDSTLDFTNKNRDTDVYMCNGGITRENIAIKNTAYIERLDTNQIALLRACIKEDGWLYITDDLLKMVEETWKAVFKVPEQYIQADGSFQDPYIMYGLNSTGDTLMFVIEYSVGEENTPTSPVENAKFETVNALREQMEKEISSAMGVDVKVMIRSFQPGEK